LLDVGPRFDVLSKAFSRCKRIVIFEMNSQPDLSAFPILRLDQVGFIDGSTLERALGELEQLISNDDHENPSMYRYLCKQFDQIKFELSSRKALDRVSKLLSGLEDPMKSVEHGFEDNMILSPARKPFIQVKQSDVLDRGGRPVGNEPSSVTKSNPSYHLSQQVSYDNQTINPAAEGNHIPESRRRLPVEPSLTVQNVSKQPITEKVITAEEKKDEISDSLSEHSAVSSHSGHSRRPRGAAAVPEPAQKEDNPSKKSLEVVYKNFGNEFIVAATTKKKRFYPQKKSSETIEDVKNRERSDR
jgi:hypothetical protein